MKTRPLRTKGLGEQWWHPQLNDTHLSCLLLRPPFWNGCNLAEAEDLDTQTKFHIIAFTKQIFLFNKNKAEK